MKNSMGTGKGRDNIYVSRWFAYEAFKFLEDKDEPRKGLMTETDEIIRNEEDIESGPNISKVGQQEPTASTSTARPTKCKRTDTNESMIRNAFEILQIAAEKLEKEPCCKSDEINAFFTYVAGKVKKYSPEMQKSVHHGVFDVLMKADKGFFDWTAPNTQNSHNWEIPSESISHPHPFSTIRCALFATSTCSITI